MDPDIALQNILYCLDHGMLDRAESLLDGLTKLVDDERCLPQAAVELRLSPIQFLDVLWYLSQYVEQRKLLAKGLYEIRNDR